MNPSIGNPLPERTYGDPAQATAKAIGDLTEGLQSWQLWTNLGWQDVQQRYRRAVLGPFWITISMMTLVLALGIIYAGMFRIEVDVFIPHIASGFVIWYYFSSTINDGN
ncbi:ABC transporter permease [Pontivivens ytuae]|uniref:ABC transporter permease n=1 Tax=Pontivivens ytuae TaxID=2789856 RepID=A0A7S9LPB8_9RHOB|nr:hypothetical protein [Pontivivens ytuae]QPH52616.1 hypothetical protein I0K15_12415 [Pontivivens ytuae]